MFPGAHLPLTPALAPIPEGMAAGAGVEAGDAHGGG